jgi:hypothetical protein
VTIPSDSDRPSAAARVRLAHRVAEALRDFDEDVTLEVVNAGDVIMGSSDDAAFRGDFVVGILDVRIRLVLLVGRGIESLTEPSILSECEHVLWSNPDTVACVLVSDDDVLTSRIVEPGDVSNRVAHSATTRETARSGPIAGTIRSFLREVIPVWSVDQFEGVSNGSPLAYDEEIRSLANQARSRRTEARALIPERREARKSLRAEDEEWAMTIAKSVLRGDLVTPDDALGRGHQ